MRPFWHGRQNRRPVDRTDDEGGHPRGGRGPLTSLCIDTRGRCVVPSLLGVVPGGCLEPWGRCVVDTTLGGCCWCVVGVRCCCVGVAASHPGARPVRLVLLVRVFCCSLFLTPCGGERGERIFISFLLPPPWGEGEGSLYLFCFAPPLSPPSVPCGVVGRFWCFR